jgi:hypothetical protein
MMFELLNEIVRFDVADKWIEIALRCIKTIRKYAPTAKILYGGVGYNAVTAVKLLAAPVDENIVYNFHCYEPLLFTHQTAQWVEGMPIDFHIGYPSDFEEYMKKSKEVPGAMVGALADKNLKVNSLGPELFDIMFRDAVETADERNAYLYCGEYGVIDQANPEDTVRWFRDIHTVFEKYGIGRAVWSYKEMDFGLSGEHYGQVLSEMVELL